MSSNGSEAEAGGSVDQLSEANPTTLFLIHNATRESTKTKYASIVRKWKQYCTEKHIPEEATTTSFANFVAVNFDRSLKYGTLRSYTAALQPYIKQVDRDVVSKLFKGVYNLRPPVPRYTAVWDVNQVLMYLAAMVVDNESDMTKRLATLLMLLSGNRVNMLSSFSIQHMTITENECTFRFDKVLKHSRPGFSNKPMTLRAYPAQKSLCPVHNIWRYLQEVRLSRSSDDNLFLTNRKPYHGWNEKILQGSYL